MRVRRPPRSGFRRMSFGPCDLCDPVHPAGSPAAVPPYGALSQPTHGIRHESHRKAGVSIDEHALQRVVTMRPMTALAILMAAASITAVALTGCAAAANEYLEVSVEQLQKQGASLDGKRLVVSGACVRMYEHGLALVSCKAFGMSVALDFAPKFDDSEIRSIGTGAYAYLMDHKSPWPAKVCGVYIQSKNNQGRWIVIDGIGASTTATPSIGSCP